MMPKKITWEETRRLQQPVTPRCDSSKRFFCVASTLHLFFLFLPDAGSPSLVFRSLRCRGESVDDFSVR